MYKGTLFGHWEAIVTFQQLIVLADADGIVDMTPQAIFAHTSIPLEILEKGLKKLAEPDPYSRTPGEEGRRIVCIDEHRPWGWQIVNYLKYKHLKDSDEVREQNRVRAQRFRDKRNAASRDVTPSNAESRYTDTDTDTDTKRTSSQARSASPVDNSPILETLPLREGGDFQVHQSLVATLEPLYPAVDIPTTLKEMKAWLVLNTERRKTKRGIRKFIGNWLQSEQEKHGR